eukprot:m.562811 g.562811  ORF g.562811 m.562811 type:complete len:96 (+) comp57808_c0_seq14:1662-1949(+)
MIRNGGPTLPAAVDQSKKGFDHNPHEQRRLKDMSLFLRHETKTITCTHCRQAFAALYWSMMTLSNGPWYCAALYSRPIRCVIFSPTPLQTVFLRL